MSNIQFRGAGASTVIHARHRRAAEEAEQKRQQELANHCPQPIQQFVPTFIPQYPTFPQYYSPIRFGGGSSSDPAADAGFGFLSDKFNNSILPGTERIKKAYLAYDKPAKFVAGEDWLRKASREPSDSTLRRDYLFKAEEHFSQAADESKSAVFKADSYRRAAITAKLNGASEANVNEYLRKGREQKNKVMEQLEGFTQDYIDGAFPNKLASEELNIFENGIDSAKQLLTEAIAMPIKIIEALSPDKSGKKPVSERIRDNAAPFMARFHQVGLANHKHYDEEMEGFSSDEEALSGRACQYKSTEKGIRFNYD